MEHEYDLSIVERGKFYREGAKFVCHVHVAADVVAHLAQLAETRGTSVTEQANEILGRAVAELASSANAGGPTAS